jgi:photosystem II stability/assembly factor-like uncharacterized protein
VKSPLVAPFVSAIVLVALAAAAPAQENVWTTHGPTGAGVVSDVAVGDGVAYAATPTGVFRSRDGGATWIQTTLTGEWIVQVVARPGTTVVLAVASPTLYVSRDEGDTWAPVPDVPSQAAAIDPGQPSTLYSGAYQGIWRSTDSGANWLQLSTAPTANTGISFAFDSRAVYVLGFAPTNRYELQQSRDGGVSWAIVSTPIPSPTAVAAGVASGLVYIGGSGTFCRSADSTATWTCSSFPSTEAPFLIHEVPADGSGAAPRVLAISDAGAYASSDGTTWVRVAVELDTTGSVETFASDVSGSLVLAGTNVGIFRSPDHGDTWTPASVGLRSSAINALAVDPQNPSTVWAIGYGFDGKDSGLFRSGDAGLTWSLGSGPDGSFGALAIDPEHSSTLYAGGSGVYRSLDGGGVWTGSTLPGGAVAHSLAADPRLPERVWAASSGGLFRSDDGVQSWTSSPAVAQEVYSILFDGKQPGTMYAGSYFDDVEGGYYPGPEGGSIFVSRDSGASWNKRPYDFTSPVFAIAADPFLDGVLYAGTAVDGVFRSTDDGITWQASNLHLIGIKSLIADPVRLGRLYCTTDQGGVYRTTDGAQTWQPFSSGLEPFQAGSLVISPDGRWLHAGTFGGGVFDLDLESSYPCSPSATRLCLVGRRYAVDLFAAPPGGSGAAQALGDRAGYFGLPQATGDPGLPEVVVKMLPEGTFGAGGPPVFYSSLTTLPYILTVTDTVTGQTESYTSKAGAPFCGGIHIAPAASEEATLQHAAPKAGGTELSLLGGRFSITIDARKPGGSPATPVVMASGDGFGVFSIPDVSGDAAFPEIVVKMVDGRAVNGSFWFFETNLTSLDYTLIVLDRVTGKKEVWNASVPFCGSDETSLFNDSPWDP